MMQAEYYLHVTVTRLQTVLAEESCHNRPDTVPDQGAGSRAKESVAVWECL